MSDIIERLRAPVDEVGQVRVIWEMITQRKAAADEIERLWAALQQITELPRVDGNDPFEVNRRGQELRLNEQARDIARRAMENKP